MKVFFIRNGSVAQNAITDSNGYFEVTGLVSGPYTFVASGSKGFVQSDPWSFAASAMPVNMATIRAARMPDVGLWDN